MPIILLGIHYASGTFEGAGGRLAEALGSLERSGSPASEASRKFRLKYISEYFLQVFSCNRLKHFVIVRACSYYVSLIQS